MGLSVSYIDKLQRANADDLAFYPLATLERAMEDGQILHCSDNDDPAGYLWHGSVRSGYDITIYQACVDYDSRRTHLGFGMVAELIALGKAGHALGIRLRTASSSEANDFWKAIGFYCTRVSQGGVKRGRKLNHWRTDIQTPLITVPEVEPDTTPINLKNYQRMKRDGEDMPSRFSREHYS